MRRIRPAPWNPSNPCVSPTDWEAGNSNRLAFSMNGHPSSRIDGMAPPCRQASAGPATMLYEGVDGFQNRPFMFHVKHDHAPVVSIEMGRHLVHSLPLRCSAHLPAIHFTRSVERWRGRSLHQFLGVGPGLLSTEISDSAWIRTGPIARRLKRRSK